MKSSMLLSPSLIVVAALGASGCADFDRQDRVEDTRILGIRTEPAEVKFSPLYSLLPPNQRPPGFGLPSPGEIEVEAYAFDPRGGDLVTTMQFCPDNAGDSSCLESWDPAERYQDLEGAARESIAALYDVRQREVSVDQDALAARPEGRVPDASYLYDFDTAVLDEVVRGRLSIFPFTPRFVFQVENESVIDPDGASRERGFKRIPFGVDFADPTFPPDILDSLLSTLGTKICESGLEGDDFKEGTTDCYAPLPPNKNPELLGFNLYRDPQEGGVVIGETADIGKNAVLSAARGTELTLEPVFAAGTVERYQVFSFEVEANDLIIVNRKEDLALSWYTTDGDISPATGSVQFGRNLTGTWTLPSVEGSDAGDVIALVLVVRDQRGGTDFARVEVELR